MTDQTPTTMELSDGPLVVTDHGGTGRPIVLVHGLDGSAANWVDVADDLTALGRVVALDLPGFGLTPLEGRRSTVTANARRVNEVAAQLGGGALLVGNSLGGAIVLTAGAADDTAGVVLVAPALPRAGDGTRVPAVLAASLLYRVRPLADIEPRRRRRLTPEQRVNDLMALCIAPGREPSLRARTAMVATERERRDLPFTPRAWSQAIADLLWRLGRRRRFHEAADAVSAPVLLIDGALDPVIPSASAAEAAARHPWWQRVELEGVGHVPQLEAPGAVVAAVTAWARALDLTTATPPTSRPAPDSP